MRKAFSTRRLYTKRKSLEPTLSVLFALAIVFLGISLMPVMFPGIVIIKGIGL